MVKARVVYTKKHMWQLLRLRSILSYLIFIGCTLYVLFNLALYAGIPLLCLIAGDPLPDGFFRNAAFMLFLAAAVVFLDLWVFVLSPLKAYKKHQDKYGDMPILFEIGENDIRVEAKSSGYESFTRFSYDKLDRAIETNGYFVLSPRAMTAYIIGKHEITEGSAEQLRDLLRNKMGSKFKSK